MTHQPIKMSYFSVARRSFQAGGQRGSLYLIAVSIKGLTDLFKTSFLKSRRRRHVGSW